MFQHNRVPSRGIHSKGSTKSDVSFQKLLVLYTNNKANLKRPIIYVNAIQGQRIVTCVAVIENRRQM